MKSLFRNAWSSKKKESKSDLNRQLQVPSESFLLPSSSKSSVDWSSDVTLAKTSVPSRRKSSVPPVNIERSAIPSLPAGRKRQNAEESHGTYHLQLERNTIRPSVEGNRRISRRAATRSVGSKKEYEQRKIPDFALQTASPTPRSAVNHSAAPLSHLKGKQDYQTEMDHHHYQPTSSAPYLRSKQSMPEFRRMRDPISDVEADLDSILIEYEGYCGRSNCPSSRSSEESVQHHHITNVFAMLDSMIAESEIPSRDGIANPGESHSTPSPITYGERVKVEASLPTSRLPYLRKSSSPTNMDEYAFSSPSPHSEEGHDSVTAFSHLFPIPPPLVIRKGHKPTPLLIHGVTAKGNAPMSPSLSSTDTTPAATPTTPQFSPTTPRSPQSPPRTHFTRSDIVPTSILKKKLSSSIIRYPHGLPSPPTTPDYSSSSLCQPPVSPTIPPRPSLRAAYSSSNLKFSPPTPILTQHSMSNGFASRKSSEFAPRSSLEHARSRKRVLSRPEVLHRSPLSTDAYLHPRVAPTPDAPPPKHVQWHAI